MPRAAWELPSSKLRASTKSARQRVGSRAREARRQRWASRSSGKSWLRSEHIAEPLDYFAEIEKQHRDEEDGEQQHTVEELRRQGIGAHAASTPSSRHHVRMVSPVTAIPWSWSSSRAICAYEIPSALRSRSSEPRLPPRTLSARGWSPERPIALPRYFQSVLLSRILQRN